jgi:hypothetical protein
MQGQVAFIDLDGVVIRNQKRAEEAQNIARAATIHLAEYMDDKALESVRKSIFYHNKTFYNPDLLILDEVIEDAPAAIDALELKGHTIVFFSSRPEHMRGATELWLVEHGISTIGRHLVLKPPAAQYVKTVTWKALMLDSLAMFLNAHSVLFVDDEVGNVDEAIKHIDTRFNIKTYASLKEAAQA